MRIIPLVTLWTICIILVSSLCLSLSLSFNSFCTSPLPMPQTDEYLVKVVNQSGCHTSSPNFAISLFLWINFLSISNFPGIKCFYFYSLDGASAMGEECMEVSRLSFCIVAWRLSQDVKYILNMFWFFDSSFFIKALSA